MSSDQCHLMMLPSEVLREIFTRLAKVDYNSLRQLGRTCSYLKRQCDEFIAKNPPEIFRGINVIPEPTSSDDEYYDDYEEYGEHRDDLEAIVEEMYDRFSLGSNYDEDAYEYLHGDGAANQ